MDTQEVVQLLEQAIIELGHKGKDYYSIDDWDHGYAAGLRAAIQYIQNKEDDANND